MNKIRICEIRGLFNGIYQWGEGWSESTALKWDNYLKNYKGIYWKPVKIRDIWYLVTTGGSIYLHPMDFQACLRNCGGKSYSPSRKPDDLRDYFGGQLEELYTLCSELAKVCGGKFTSLVAQTQVVDNPDLKQLIKGDKFLWN